MNAFGTTRQDVGGDETGATPSIAAPKKRWKLVPFGPCHIPRYMVRFPQAETAEGNLTTIFGACMGGAGYQNPAPGITLPAPPPPPILPPPTALPLLPDTFGGVKRMWHARLRVAGGLGYSQIGSPGYVGPIRITGIRLTSTLNSAAGFVGSYMMGASPVAVSNLYGVTFASQLPSGSFIDSISASNNEHPQAQSGGQVPDFGFERTMFNDNVNVANPPMDLDNLDIDIMFNPVFLWLALSNVTGSADIVDILIRFKAL